MITARVKQPNYRDVVLPIVFQTKTRAVYAANVIGAEVVAFLRSLTDEMRPPARAGEGERQAHPGGWADVRGTLANSYDFQVEETEFGARLILLNTAEYAVYLELRDGYYVLSGVDEPGGPLDTILRARAEMLGFKYRG